MKRNGIFQTVKPAKVGKSAFNLSHEKKMSFDMGQLIPCFIQEVVPGDKFSIKTQSMIRFAPLAAPVMHRINAYIHYFYVPNRILWEDWENFITKESLLTPPFGNLPTLEIGTIGDYLGLPIIEGRESTEKINIMSLMAYIKIWNEYYRDENLQSEIDLSYSNGTGWNHIAVYLNQKPFRRSWEKDYFTSALPNAQQGSMPVSMLGDVILRQDGTKAYTSGTSQVNASGSISAMDGKLMDELNFDPLIIDNVENVTIDVNELRRATRLQRWLERNLRAGHRYTEHLLAHWGILSDDARMQRPEYIGGGKSPVVVSEVLNMAQSQSNDVGEMYGHAINVGIANEASKFCKEHGYIMGIMSVMPDPAYMQGLPKHFSRLDTLDYYFPEFAQLGEQEVLMKELYFTDNNVDNSEVFGYQSRYAEYKYAPNTVHGEFRNTLEYWHLARKFANKPQLNSTFLQCNPDTRIFAVEETPQKLWAQIYHDVVAVRPMPYYNDPTL